MKKREEARRNVKGNDESGRAEFRRRARASRGAWMGLAPQNFGSGNDQDSHSNGVTTCTFYKPVARLSLLLQDTSETAMTSPESGPDPVFSSLTEGLTELPFPPVTKKHILNCSYHSWHPRYGEHKEASRLKNTDSSKIPRRHT